MPGLERLVEPLQRNAAAVFGEPIADARRAALHRCAPLRGRRHPDRAVRRRAAHPDRGQRQAADERLALADLRKATEVVALTLLDLLKRVHGRLVNSPGPPQVRRKSFASRRRMRPRSTWLNASMKTVIPERMKTAVSLPDPLFKAADQLARQLGKSRSQLYAEALRDYLERHRDEDITRRLTRFTTRSRSSLSSIGCRCVGLSLEGTAEGKDGKSTWRDIWWAAPAQPFGLQTWSFTDPWPPSHLGSPAAAPARSPPSRIHL